MSNPPETNREYMDGRLTHGYRAPGGARFLRQRLQGRSFGQVFCLPADGNSSHMHPSMAYWIPCGPKGSSRGSAAGSSSAEDIAHLWVVRYRTSQRSMPMSRSMQSSSLARASASCQAPRFHIASVTDLPINAIHRLARRSIVKLPILNL